MRRARETRGSALVEMSLVLGVLMLLLMGIFDLGRAVFAYSDLSETSREAARYAVMHVNDVAGTRSTAVGRSSLPLVAARDVQVHFTPANLPNKISASVQVTVSYQFQAVSLMVARVIGGNGTIDMHSSSLMIGE